ncbi:hypothetical protein WOLCODRAFT_151745 [Wolfiporia cocos MD-104 SS10]|uniref:Uncharacterized protein n=1 Tax=Wolfiporia cocos (strain MD-104) TaxID=742152 RepID=A0A2H3JY76_WOLCO|nr:hypothetical protein WOLCODRAFT_151745 [Wolfiporia cocos MD-104 SS10]
MRPDLPCQGSARVSAGKRGVSQHLPGRRPCNQPRTAAPPALPTAPLDWTTLSCTLPRAPARQGGPTRGGSPLRPRPSSGQRRKHLGSQHNGAHRPPWNKTRKLTSTGPTAWGTIGNGQAPRTGQSPPSKAYPGTVQDRERHRHQARRQRAPGPRLLDTNRRRHSHSPSGQGVSTPRHATASPVHSDTAHGRLHQTHKAPPPTGVPGASAAARRQTPSTLPRYSQGAGGDYKNLPPSNHLNESESTAQRSRLKTHRQPLSTPLDSDAVTASQAKTAARETSQRRTQQEKSKKKKREKPNLWELNAHVGLGQPRTRHHAQSGRSGHHSDTVPLA